MMHSRLMKQSQVPSVKPNWMAASRSFDVRPANRVCSMGARAWLFHVMALYPSSSSAIIWEVVESCSNGEKRKPGLA